MERSQADVEPRDGELVERARGGCAGALAELITRYQDSVYNLCYRLCHDETEALDLAQSALTKVLEGLPRFQARAKFSTWLYRITVNVVLSHRRWSRRRPVVALDGPPDAAREEPPDDRGADPGETLERKDACERVQAALARVETEFRVALVLKDVEGMDYAAIADILQVPIGTVKSRIHRGRVMLRELLTAERAAVVSEQA